MSLLRTTLLNGIAVFIKLASALVLNKILAVYLGPAGYAVIGQFQNALSIIVSLAGGVVATGVTKATAQHFDDEAKQHAVWQTAIRFSLLASIIGAIPLLLMGDRLAQWLLHRTDMPNVFTWLAFCLPALAANNLLLAVINGKKEVGVYISANIIGSLITMMLVGLLAINYGLYGALVALTISPVFVLLTTATIVTRRDWCKTKFLWGQTNRPALRELSGFALMGLTSALAAPISYMVIREHLTTTLGLTSAGYWQASWTISEIYLMLVTTTLSVYYLPRLSEIRTVCELKDEISNVYFLLMPIAVLGAVVVFLLRDGIVSLLFTTDFLPVRELFLWQLTGDVIKIGSWVLSFIMLARSQVKVFIITEILFSAIFIFLSIFFVNFFGLVGVSLAFLINYIIYWIVMIIVVRRIMNGMDK